MPDSVGKQLRGAVEDLYRTFSRYKLPPHAAGCPDCVSEADDAIIHSAPLRHLGPGELGRFAFKAMTTWGTVGTFRHFLPRLFELVTAGGGAWIDPEVLFGKLTYGGWTRWPDAEQTAVRLYLGALWRDVLGRFPHGFDVDSCICCVGQAQDDVQPFLDAWDVPGSAAAARHFAAFVDGNAFRVSNKPSRPWKLQNPWWRDRPHPAGQVTRWLLAPERLDALERAFFSIDPADEATAASLSAAFNDLSSIRIAAGVA